MELQDARAVLALVRERRTDNERLEERYDEIREALEWFGENVVRDALELAFLLQPFWLTSGRSPEAMALLDALLADPKAQEQTLARAGAAFARGEFAFRQGENERARELYEEALAIARREDDWNLTRLAFVGLGRAALRTGDYERVRELGEQGQELARSHDDRDAEWLPLHLQAASARMSGDYERAWQLYEQSVELARQLDRPNRVPAEQHNMGYLALHQGDLGRAKALFREAAEQILELRDEYLLPYALLDFAIVGATEGRDKDAARLVGTAAAFFEARETIPDPDDQAEYERVVSELRQRLGEAEFERAFAEGKSLDAERTLADVLGRHAQV